MLGSNHFAFFVLRYSNCAIQKEFVLTTKVWKSFYHISLSHSLNEAILLVTTPYHDLHSKETPIDSCLNDHGLNIESLVGSIVDIIIIHIFKLFRYSYDHGCSFSSFFQACMMIESWVPFQLKFNSGHFQPHKSIDCQISSRIVSFKN